MTDVITLPQAAHLLGKSHYQTYRLCLRRDLPAEQRADNRWYVDREAVERMAATERDPAPQAA